MAKTATLSIRIDPKTKSQAEKIFAKLGISLSTAVNMFFRQTINERAVPFRPQLDRPEIPNDETIAAMQECDQMLEEIKAGKRVPRCKSVEELFAELER